MHRRHEKKRYLTLPGVRTCQVVIAHYRGEEGITDSTELVLSYLLGISKFEPYASTQHDLVLSGLKPIMGRSGSFRCSDHMKGDT